MIVKPERHRCPSHLRWVATQRCIACFAGGGGWPLDSSYRRALSLSGITGEVISQAHHLTHAQPKARGLKSGDQWVVPLCVGHHDPNNRASVHAAGNERRWWQSYMLDPLPIAEALWAASVAAGRVRAMKEAA